MVTVTLHIHNFKCDCVQDERKHSEKFILPLYLPSRNTLDLSFYTPTFPRKCALIKTFTLYEDAESSR